MQANQKSWTVVPVEEGSTLIGMAMCMPGGHATLDGGAAADCIGEVAASRVAQAIAATGDGRIPVLEDKTQKFKFCSEGNQMEASFAVSLPVTIGEPPTWLEASVECTSSLSILLVVSFVLAVLCGRCMGTFLAV